MYVPTVAWQDSVILVEFTDAESPESFPPVQTGPGGNIGSGGCGGSTITTTTTTTDGGSYFLPPSERTAAINIDYEGENSCCSTQLSLDISDVLSVESKSTTRKNGASGSPASNKPPIPTAISCTSSPMTSRFVWFVVDSTISFLLERKWECGMMRFQLFS